MASKPITLHVLAQYQLPRFFADASPEEVGTALTAAAELIPFATQRVGSARSQSEAQRKAAMDEVNALSAQLQLHSARRHCTSTGMSFDINCTDDEGLLYASTKGHTYVVLDSKLSQSDADLLSDWFVFCLFT